MGSESKKSTPQGTTLQQHDTGTHVPCVTYRDEQSGPGTGTKIFFHRDLDQNFFIAGTRTFFSPGSGPEFLYRRDRDRDQKFFLAGTGTGTKFFFSPGPGLKMTDPAHV